MMGDKYFDFGGVNGPVQAGDGVQYAAGRDQYLAHGAQHVAGRDQVIHGGASRELLAEVTSLRQVLAELRLTSTERDSAAYELTAMEDAVRQDNPDRQALGQHLGAFVQGLREAGSLASAGTSLIESLSKIARWLGPLGAGVLALL
jgi:hypothetical protein